MPRLSGVSRCFPHVPRPDSDTGKTPPQWTQAYAPPVRGQQMLSSRPEIQMNFTSNAVSHRSQPSAGPLLPSAGPAACQSSLESACWLDSCFMILVLHPLGFFGSHLRCILRTQQGYAGRRGGDGGAIRGGVGVGEWVQRAGWRRTDGPGTTRPDANASLGRPQRPGRAAKDVNGRVWYKMEPFFCRSVVTGTDA
jgi:hypothetical protein